MQETTHCETAALRSMIHEPNSMTSLNGQISDVAPIISKAEDILSIQDQPTKAEEIIRSSPLMTNNDSIVTSLGVQSINPTSLWSATSASGNTLSDEHLIQSLNSLNSEMALHQYQSQMVANATRPIFPSSLNYASNPAANSVSNQGRRPITGHSSITNFPRQPSSNMLSSGNNSHIMQQWNNSQQLSSWHTQQQQQTQMYPHMNSQRRSSPNLYGTGLAKKQIMQQHLQQQAYANTNKFKRNTNLPGQSSMMPASKSPYDFSALEEAVKLQSPPSYDFSKYSPAESQFYDVMKKGHLDGTHDLAGKLSYMLEETTLADHDSLDQTVPNLSSPPGSSPTSQGIDRIERFSRKVFVGGLPPDIDEEEITTAFRRFGALVVDWPHKAESKSYFPPKGYCFLIFQDESSVQNLIESCLMDEDKLYWCVSSPTMKDKPVQIRPWSLSDSDFVMDGSQPLDPRKTIFVGGVPRPLRAVELAMIMDRLYGGVCYAGIDTDPELKYPKGAGRVAFSNQQSYIAAISARFVQLQYGDIDKRVEVKPYVLDDQMCDECRGARCAGKFAPFFCANVTCLQYYCEYCWAQIHSRPGREYHKPLVKEGADRPRAVPFRWC